MQLAKYTNREEKKKEKKKRKKRKERREGKRVRKACVNPSRRTYPLREYSNRNPFDRERRLLPNPSIGFNGHRYSNLYSTRGSRSSLHPFSQPVEATFAPSQRRITVRRIQLLGSTRGRKEKGWNLHSVFFSLSPFLLSRLVCSCRVYDIVSPPILAKLERKRRRQMQGNLRSFFFFFCSL